MASQRDMKNSTAVARGDWIAQGRAPLMSGSKRVPEGTLVLYGEQQIHLASMANRVGPPLCLVDRVEGDRLSQRRPGEQGTIKGNKDAKPRSTKKIIPGARRPASLPCNQWSCTGILGYIAMDGPGSKSQRDSTSGPSPAPIC